MTRQTKLLIILFIWKKNLRLSYHSIKQYFVAKWTFTALGVIFTFLQSTQGRFYLIKVFYMGNTKRKTNLNDFKKSKIRNKIFVHIKTAYLEYFVMCLWLYIHHILGQNIPLTHNINVTSDIAAVGRRYNFKVFSYNAVWAENQTHMTFLMPSECATC